MGLFTKDIQTMDDLLLHGLQDIYYAENRIVKSLPKLIEKATNRDLSKGLKDHLGETEKQVARLDQVFKLLGKEPQGVKCPREAYCKDLKRPDFSITTLDRYAREKGIAQGLSDFVQREKRQAR